MKIIVTGSLGNISRPLTEELIRKEHSVTVISSNPEKQNDIESFGATAAIGSLKDVAFLTKTFMDADAVYCMNPPDYSQNDQNAYYRHIGDAYAKAIEASGVKRVVYLSSYGAHLQSGTGFITGSYLSEKILDAIPGIFLTHIRPTSFYYNLFGFIPMIKAAGFIGAVYGGDDQLAMVSPEDIASAIAAEIVELNSSKKVRYVNSDDRTCKEVATVLGKAIGIPDLKWHILTKEQVMQSLLSHDISENAATNLVELGLAIHSGRLRKDYDLHEPETGKVRLEDFAKEFASVYHS